MYILHKAAIVRCVTQLIKDDLAAVQPAVGECRHLAEQMSAVCGASGGTISIQKRLEDLNAAIEEIEEGVEKRETDLNKALNRAEQCTNCVEVIHIFTDMSPDFG